MRPVSFHSTHAASQALQPMHVVVSMYLETTGTVRIPDRLPQTEAEERRISRFCTLIFASSRLVQLDQEGLELGGPGVRIHGRGGQEVGQRAGVVGVAGVAPVNGEADLPYLLPIDLHRQEPLG